MRAFTVVTPPKKIPGILINIASSQAGFCEASREKGTWTWNHGTRIAFKVDAHDEKMIA